MSNSDRPENVKIVWEEYFLDGSHETKLVVGQGPTGFHIGRKDMDPAMEKYGIQWSPEVYDSKFKAEGKVISLNNIRSSQRHEILEIPAKARGKGRER